MTEGFDPLLLLVLVLALIAGAALGALIFRRGGSGKEAEVSEISEALSRQETQLAEHLRKQERELTQMVDKRLSDLSHRMGQNLQHQATQQHKTLAQLGERLAVIDKAQQKITELSSQVVSLQDVLANKQERGAFGEIQLNDLVTAVLPPSAYAFQATLSGGRRADCLLQLPNPPGPIVIDAKFPLESYRALRAAQYESEKTEAARQFRLAVRKHIKDIAERYIVPGETAESALMFLPSEAVYAELHANFAEVVEDSYRARVWIVSPTTLMATLNTVRAVLKDVHMREQAGVIQQEVIKLLEDVTRLDDRVGKLQRHFDQANEDVRQIRISTEKVTKRAERVGELELEETSEAIAEITEQKQ